MTAITIRGLYVRRGGKLALSHLDADIESGRVTGLLGPSGSGKTTFMRAIVGVQVIERGSVRVLGDPAGSPQLRRRVAYITQAPSVYQDLTVRENLRYFARILDVPPQRIDEAIETVDLGEESDRVVNGLSGGERARASLATALLGEPEVLVLDEPTVGLDPVLRRDLWSTFKRLAEDGATLLVSSHVMDEADRCDELLLMRQGRILEHATPADVLRQTDAQDLDEAFLRLIEGA